MTQVVLLRGWLACLGWGDGDFDQVEGVVCLGFDDTSLLGFAAAAAKDKVVCLCLAPGLREFATAMLYCLITSGFVSLRGIWCWKAKRAWAIITSLLNSTSWSGEYGVTLSGMVGRGFLGRLLRDGLVFL